MTVNYFVIMLRCVRKGCLSEYPELSYPDTRRPAPSLRQNCSMMEIAKIDQKALRLYFQEGHPEISAMQVKLY